MKAKLGIALACCCFFAGCSSSGPEDVQAALPGIWQCEEITVTLGADGKYEWANPPGTGVHIAGPGNEHVRTNPDGSYVILGNWRGSGDRVEIDMMGETDTYTVKFSSNTSMEMSGPDNFKCEKR